MVKGCSRGAGLVDGMWRGEGGRPRGQRGRGHVWEWRGGGAHEVYVESRVESEEVIMIMFIIPYVTPQRERATTAGEPLLTTCQPPTEAMRGGHRGAVELPPAAPSRCEGLATV